MLTLQASLVVVQFESGTRILRVIHARDARATLSNCTTTDERYLLFRSITRATIARVYRALASISSSMGTAVSKIDASDLRQRDLTLASDDTSKAA